MTTYVVPVSGGKDSQAVLQMAIAAHGVDHVIPLHHATGIDHPLTYEHMDYMARFYGVRIAHTHNDKYRDILDLIEKRMFLPGRKTRVCTDEMKIQAFNRWLLTCKLPLSDVVVLMGMRSDESQNRNRKYGDLSPDDEFSLRDMMPKKVPKVLSAVRVRLPIVDWSRQRVFDYLAEAGAKVNPLYARGHRRVGCYPCLLAGPREWRLVARDPHGRQMIEQLNVLKFRVIEHGLNERAGKKVFLDDDTIAMDLAALLWSESPDNPNFDPFNLLADMEDVGGCNLCVG